MDAQGAAGGPVRGSSLGVFDCICDTCVGCGKLYAHFIDEAGKTVMGGPCPCGKSIPGVL